MVKKVTERTPFGARMFESRKKSGLSQEVVCQRIGCAQGTLSELERLNDGSALTPMFAELYKVNSKWLATGKGDMNARVTQQTQEVELTPQEARFLDAYRKQPSEEIRLKALDILSIGVNATAKGKGRIPTQKEKKAA